MRHIQLDTSIRIAISVAATLATEGRLSKCHIMHWRYNLCRLYTKGAVQCRFRANIHIPGS